MTDLESLGLVILAVYLTECLVLIRRGALLCVRGLRGWTILTADRGLTTAHGAWRFLNLIPRFPASFQSALWPFSANPSHLVAWTSLSAESGGRPTQSGLVIRWDDIPVIEVDRRQVLIEKVKWFEARSYEEAVVLAKRLNRLRQGDARTRERALDAELRESLDLKQLRERRRELEAAMSRVVSPAAFLFLSVVLFSPLLIYRLGLSTVGWWLLGGIYLQAIILSVILYFQHRKLYPDNDEDRLLRVLSAALSPVSAMRSPDFLARHAFERFHPLAVTREFCPEAEFQRLAGMLVRDFVHPRLPEHPSGDETVVEVERAMRSRWRHVLERFLKGEGYEWAAYLKAPEPTEVVNKVYCPRCLAQFVEVGAVCMECGQRPTVPLRVAGS